jgi:hypothetical protein
MTLNLAISIPLYTPLTRMDAGFVGFLRDDYFIGLAVDWIYK